MKTAQLSLKFRKLKAEVIATLLYGCVTLTLSAKTIAKLRYVHNQVLLRVIDFQRRPRTDHTTLSCAKDLKKTRCESIEATIRKQRLFVAGGMTWYKRGAMTESSGFCDHD